MNYRDSVKRRLRLVVTLVPLFLFVWLMGATAASADSGHRTYRWLAGQGDTGFGNLCDFGLPCPDQAFAPNGDALELAGEGTLSIHPKSVSGSGTFTYYFDGGSIGGSWTATELLSFTSYGPSPALPPTFEAGKAQIRIHFVADGGAGEVDGILTLGCILPDVKVPGGLFEGIRVNVLGAINFNQTTPAATLFIRQ